MSRSQNSFGFLTYVDGEDWRSKIKEKQIEFGTSPVPRGRNKSKRRSYVAFRVAIINLESSSCIQEWVQTISNLLFFNLQCVDLYQCHRYDPKYAFRRNYDRNR
ncbi:hypothetical protein [Nostoc sp. UIC 10630]|uniref:hypothetical protein n=1 Tax=Nostoc sp. UIC 10630 TaxID=2100146 RepID=UPI0013D8B9AC|nr:hypothetical protein [Nostoc sp. UIC 10630]NEU81321.1 hypothetical protein [Nostoc sp. UIC 10630]